MKLLIATSIYQRYELTEIVLNYYSKMQESMRLVNRVHSIELLAIGSSNRAKEICEKVGWNYLTWANNPLSFKMNGLFMRARQFNPDAVLLINSDNLLDANLIFYYLNNFSANEERLVGMRDIYFYSPQHNKTIYFEGYKKKEQSTGAGRFFSKKVLDKMDWCLWGNEGVNKGLDSVSSRRMLKNGIKEHLFTMADANGVCVDIKTDTNITSWVSVQGSYNNGYVDNEILFKEFPEEMEKVKKLAIGSKQLAT